MEVYVLDDLLRRNTVIDRFESCIWTERYSAMGDFQLVMHSTSQSRGQLQKGLLLGMNRSRRVMKIENVEDKDDSEGRSLLTVSGRSLELVLTQRATRGASILSGGAISDNWESTGTPGDIARNLVDRFIRTNTDIPADNIPFIQSPTTTLYPASTIPEPSDSITIVIENGQIYDRLKEICDTYGLGFRIYRGPDNQKLYFNVYSGSDRTSSQITLPAVIFSPDLENLTNTSEFSSIEQEKNIAYVLGKDKTVVVYAAGAEASTAGFDRKVLIVDAGDITGTDLAATTKLEQKGYQELSKYKPLEALDGELPQTSKYVYDVDYSLGDLVEIRNDEGSIQRKRVTEQIFVDDASGERSYPTLTADIFITPGSWSAWDANGVWDTAPGVWAFADPESPSAENILPNPGFELLTLPTSVVGAGSTQQRTNTAGSFRSGDYGLTVITTGANGGVVGTVSAHAESPVGPYTGWIWVKTTSTHGYKVKVQEYTTAGVLVSESAVVTGSGNGAFQQVALNYTKTQAATVLRLSVTKDVAGTFYLDDADLHMVL